MRDSSYPRADQLKKQRLAEFEQRCRTLGILMTPQRRLVLEAVLDLDCHPTADQVHNFLRTKKARISRATVYRTLESLVEMEIITKTCHPGGVIRYDGRTELHHHLVCLSCDAVIDISDERLNELPIPDTSAFKFEVKDFRVQLRGLCGNCRKQREEEVRK
jgi:Fur family peroxide stress response transcriptional regulator